MNAWNCILSIEHWTLHLKSTIQPVTIYYPAVKQENKRAHTLQIVRSSTALILLDNSRILALFVTRNLNGQVLHAQREARVFLGVILSRIESQQGAEIVVLNGFLVLLAPLTPFLLAFLVLHYH